MEQVFDVAIIGGGINGCGAAADAAMRGLSVVLLEKNNLASKTSSSSSKLIHGGLRYLEQYDFALVKKALNERQLLLELAPHLVRPLPFILPYQEHMRPQWLLRTGLFFYDHLSAKNTLPHAKLIRNKPFSPYFSPLAKHYDKGFLFYDCSTDDARLTIANALQAKEHGALILRDTELQETKVDSGIWQLLVQAKTKKQLIKAKTLINATGPWAEATNQCLQVNNPFQLSLVKGSHLVVHKLYEGEHAYLLQNEDQRIIFIIPYQGYTMIGTTDVNFSDSLEKVTISSAEIDYLFRLVNQYLHTALERKHIISSWSGIRPLIAGTGDSLSRLSRDYICHFSMLPAPSVTIYGGKITTYRQSSLDAVNLLKPIFPELKPSVSADHPLPGAYLGPWSFSEYAHHAREKYFWLEESIKERFLASYGTRTELLLADCGAMADLGQSFGHGLYQREVDYLVQTEWAKQCDDILWRRTKLGLRFKPLEKQNLSHYLGCD